MIRASPRRPSSSPVAESGATDQAADRSPLDPAEVAVWGRTKLPERPWKRPTTRPKPTQAAEPSSAAYAVSSSAVLSPSTSSWKVLVSRVRKDTAITAHPQPEEEPR